jgi:hypothetical protein
LGELFFCVHHRGGFVSVNNSKAWSRIRDDLCIDKKASNTSPYLRKLYEQWLLAVEVKRALP